LHWQANSLPVVIEDRPRNRLLIALSGLELAMVAANKPSPKVKENDNRSNGQITTAPKYGDVFHRVAPAILIKATFALCRKLS